MWVSARVFLLVEMKLSLNDEMRFFIFWKSDEMRKNEGIKKYFMLRFNFRPNHKFV